MKQFCLTLVFVTLLAIGHSQALSDRFGQKTVFSVGADLVPIAFLEGIANLGFGGSFGLQIISNDTASFVVNAGYLLYAKYPGTYGGHSDDLEYIPVSLSLRMQTKGNFYFGPKAGFNIDAKKPYDPPLHYNKFNFHGGLTFGVCSEKKRFNPDFSLLYHSTVYGSMFSFQSSLRLRFLSQRR